jgi:arsenate reductase
MLTPSDAVESLAALAQEHRLAAYRLLVQAGEAGLSAGAIAEHLDLPPSSLSFHLTHLARAGLIEQQRHGRSQIYRANYVAMTGLIDFLTENCCGGATCDPAIACAPVVRGGRGMSDVTIWHNPACGTSRNTLAMIRATGVQPEVIEYLETPPSRAKLVELIAAAGLTPRAVLRQKGTPYAELGLDDAGLSDAALLDAMLAHPILINRPLVETPGGVRLCRPSELVLGILADPLPADFVKEDGEVVRA